MAEIKISDLNLVGSTLLIDSESYLNELTNDEISISGGRIGISRANLGISVSRGQSVSIRGVSVSRGQGFSYKFW